ncbi:MAG: long-chain fatty acid--CoA ligase [Planctomycetes bacterium]|nr:long-chain fatty acid--CoA ligase [Planctomycetota bacterium]MCB9905500.1 long-chain fatty acid--CoA ligase [Planctomycetota bacterium]
MEERIWHRHYPAGTPTSIDYEERALPEFLRDTARRTPDAPALAFFNRELSYRELDDHVSRFGRALADLGVGPGRRVAIHLPNLPQTVIAYQAALAIRAQVVLTNPLYTSHELEHQWNDAEIDVAVTADFLYEQTIAADRSKLSPRHYVVASIPDYMRFPLSWLAPLKLRRSNPPTIAKVEFGDGVHSFMQLVESSSPDAPRPEIDLNEIAVLQYTGGTTGRSKGAELTHRNLSVNVQQCEQVLIGAAGSGPEVMMSCLPLFHVFGMTVCMNLSLRIGAKIVLQPNPRDIKELVNNLESHHVTIFPGVPALFNSINHFPRIDQRDLSKLRVCVSGSAPIADDVLRRFEQLTSSRILEGFGLSETSPVTHVNPLSGLRKVGSIGIPVPDTDARVVDPDDGVKELPTGEVGELLLKGPQVMRGYWKQPDQTADALRDGWFHTGDLASIDEDGFFKIEGRMKDMINCNGLKVYPDEVDGVLMSHPLILEAATIGVPHPRRIETVKSFVVLQPGAKLGVEEIREFCAKELAKYKVPDEIEFLDELPKSNVLKVLRRELRDRELVRRGLA